MNNTIPSTTLFSQAQSLILDLILEPWSETRVQILRGMLENASSMLDGHKDEFINTITNDLRELCLRRWEVARVNEVRADEIRAEVAQGHLDLIARVSSNFKF